MAEFFGFNCGIGPFCVACCFKMLSRGSVLCLLNASFGKRFHVLQLKFFCQNVGAIQGEYLPDYGGVQVASKVALDMLHRVMFTASHWHISASLWPSNGPQWRYVYLSPPPFFKKS